MGAIDHRRFNQHENLYKIAGSEENLHLCIYEILKYRRQIAQTYINAGSHQTEIVNTCIDAINQCNQKLIEALLISTTPILPIQP